MGVALKSKEMKQGIGTVTQLRWSPASRGPHTCPGAGVTVEAEGPSLQLFASQRNKWFWAQTEGRRALPPSS